MKTMGSYPTKCCGLHAKHKITVNASDLPSEDLPPLVSMFSFKSIVDLSDHHGWSCGAGIYRSYLCNRCLVKIRNNLDSNEIVYMNEYKPGGYYRMDLP